jgi:SAM-dependent methyltransferase
MTMTVDSAVGAIHRALVLGDHDQAFDLAVERMALMPNDSSSLFLMGLATHEAGDELTTVQILREILTRFPDDQLCRAALILELGAQATSVDDLAEVAQLVAGDFYTENTVSTALRYLLTKPGDDVIGLDFVVDGVDFSWPLLAARAGYQLLYQHLPLAHNSLPAVERFYNEFDRYEDSQIHRIRRIGPLIGQAAHFAPGDRVLDVGCGTGHILAYIVDAFLVQPFGVDLSEGAGAISRRLVPNIDFRVCQPDHIPHADDSFDRVICSDVLEHVRRPWLLAAELARVCRPGGELVVSVPDGRYDDFIGHINFFSTQSLETMLEEHGDVRISVHTDGLLATVTLA